MAALGSARAIGYLAYALIRLPYPLEVWYLEAAMVHLAWRAQAGVRFYPPWDGYPHVANFYGPCYFGLVGLLGSAFKLDIPGLFLIGRGVSFGSGLLTTLGLGWYIGHRYGKGAGVIGAVLSLGASPMFGFSVMVRPDLTAELVGIVGFFLAVHRSRLLQFAACPVLVLAVLTKQTAAIFPLASVIALGVTGRRREAWIVLVGCSTLLGAIVVGVTVCLEPMFGPSLLGPAKTPFGLSELSAAVKSLAVSAPDLLLIPMMGLGLWAFGVPRQPEKIVLAVVVLVASLISAGKSGSDLNYFVSLRIIEALAVGALWKATWKASAVSHARDPRGLAVAAVLGAVALVPGAFLALKHAREAWDAALFLDGQHGSDLLHRHRQLRLLAQDPDVQLLTNCQMIALYQKGRAPFVDPWQFRVHVQTGQVRPEEILRNIENEKYFYIIDCYYLDSDLYQSEVCGLPSPLFESARRHYDLMLNDPDLGLFIYRRRHAPPARALGAGY